MKKSIVPKGRSFFRVDFEGKSILEIHLARPFFSGAGASEVMLDFRQVSLTLDIELIIASRDTESLSHLNALPTVLKRRLELGAKAFVTATNNKRRAAALGLRCDIFFHN
jgi:hypothetical protein